METRTDNNGTWERTGPHSWRLVETTAEFEEKRVSDAPPPPDPTGFLAAARDEYGEDFWYDLADAMPSLHVAITALQSGDVRTARRGITRMVVRGFLTEQQAQDIEAAMETYGLTDRGAS